MSSPWIIKKKHFKKIKSLILNSHGTRLPQYRGGASFSWQVMNKTRFGFLESYVGLPNGILKCCTLFLHVSEKFTSLKPGVIFVGLL